MSVFNSINVSQKRCDFVVKVNGNKMHCVKDVVCDLSPVIKNFVKDHHKSRGISIKIPKLPKVCDYSLLELLFSGYDIALTKDSVAFLNQVAKYLEIEKLKSAIDDFSSSFNSSIDDITRTRGINKLEQLEDDLLDISAKFPANSKECIFTNIDELISISKEINIEILSRTIFSVCIARPKNIETVLDFLFVKLDKEIPKLIPYLTNFLMKELKKAMSFKRDRSYFQEICFLLRKLIVGGFLNPNEIESMKSIPVYFSDLVRSEETWKLLSTKSEFISFQNIKKYVQKNNWEAHKQNCIKGYDPNQLLELIRMDKVEMFQQLINADSSNDINKTIEKSVYERSSIMNTNCTYLEYAAFHSSIRCFKFLVNYQNIKIPKNLALYAIAGGNAEIIHICEHYECQFTASLKIAIQYHQNNIFQWLIETKMQNFHDKSLIGECLRYSNFNALCFLILKGADLELLLVYSAKYNHVSFCKLTDDLEYLNGKNKIVSSTYNGKAAIHYSSKNGNLEITKHLLSIPGNDPNIKTTDIKKLTPLHFACIKGHIGIAKLLLKQKMIDVNAKSGIIVISFLIIHLSFKK